MPDYYPRFVCKMGACRSACCVGWPVSVTMENYFELVGVDCSPELRQRLDCALHLLPHPTKEAYAAITPRWDGNCPLRAEDGRCALQIDLGEEVLSDVCRLYPRGIRSENGEFECSCAGSCEGVLEMLLAHAGTPLAFIRKELTTLVPQSAARSVFFETFGHEWELRKRFLDVIQDPAHPLPARLSVLGELLARTDKALHTGTAEVIEALLAAPDPDPVFMPDERLTERILFGLDTAEQMMELIDSRSSSVREYGEQAISYFRSGDPLPAYKKARERFEKLLPGWEDFFSKMLANHMFFVRFPFQDRPEGMVDEFLSLCAVYGLLRFLLLGNTADGDGDGISHVIDVCASAFRLIDHTDFDRSACALARRLSIDTQEKILDFISL